MSIKRGTGRQALIDATAEVLRRGEEVQIKEIAASVGVSHTLIYRHFPQGGKDELIAEAYAQLFRGLADADIDRVGTLLTESGPDRSAVRALAMDILDPERSEFRWARLEALAQVRVNPYAAERIEAVRRELIEAFADRLLQTQPDLSRDAALAVSLLSQALPFGVTAMGGGDLDEAQRELLADMWAGFLVDALERVRTAT